MTDLIHQSRLFQLHEPLELFDAITDVIGERAGTDFLTPLENEMSSLAKRLSATAEAMDRAADEEDPNAFRRIHSDLPPLIEELKPWLSYSTESRVEVGHNVPTTYKRAYSRLNGVSNALRETSEKGTLFQAHELTENVTNVTQYLSKLFQENVINPAQNDISELAQEMLAISKLLHRAADEEDMPVAQQAIPRFSPLINNLKRFEDKYSLTSSKRSHSTSHSQAHQSSGPSNDIPGLLKAAENQYRVTKLTKPPGNNALELYRRVLTLDPDNAEAQAGIQKIVKWFVHHAQEHAEKGQREKAKFYYDRALSIDPYDEEARKGVDRYN